MKKSLFVLFALGAGLALSSCEKCATCTFDDPVDGELTSEFCNKSHAFTNNWDNHVESGWECVED